VVVVNPSSRDTRRIEVPDDGSELAGLRGHWVGSRSLGLVSFHAYDGAADFTLATGALLPVAEGASGRLVALAMDSDYGFASTGAGGRVEVWDVETQRRLFALEDGRFRSVGFTSSPLRLICGIRHRRNEDASWLDDALEVRDAETGDLLRVLSTTDRE
jgi:hypothetical protein